MGWREADTKMASLTGGLVTDDETHFVLPAVPPLATFALSLFSMLVREAECGQMDHRLCSREPLVRL
jgi:hypothetical protein